MKALCALVITAVASCQAEAPLVAGLHTVSIDVDSPETYNTLLRFFD